MSGLVVWDAAKVHLRVIEIKAKHVLNPPPPGTEMSAFREGISDLPAEWQGLALECFTQGWTIGANVNTTEKLKYKRETGLSAVGILFILCGVGLSFVSKDLSPQQSMSCSALISLGAAGFLVFLPGFFVLQGSLKPNGFYDSMQFKSSGVVGIFLIVLLFLHFVLKF